jgi:hypothetical protein
MAEGQDEENEKPDGAHMGKMTRRKASEAIRWRCSILRLDQNLSARSMIVTATWPIEDPEG